MPMLAPSPLSLLPAFESHGLRRPRNAKESVGKRRLEAQWFESVGSLASGIAHDMNNVLAPIVILAELLKEAIPGEQARRHLDVMLQSAWRGSQTLRRVCALAECNTGDLVAINLNDIASEVAEQIAASSPVRISTRLEPTNSLWPILGDPAQIREAISALASRVVAAIPGSGCMHLKVANANVSPQMTAGRTRARPGRHVRISIGTDGFPARKREAFLGSLLANATIDHHSRLELSIAHAAIKSHFGFLRISSAQLAGTSFDIFLPAHG